jgi:hypothetical protein
VPSGRPCTSSLHLLEAGELLKGICDTIAGVAPGEPLAGQAGEPLVGRPLGRIGLFRGGPLLQAFFDIALEHLSQVVMAVELVLVVDAHKGLYGFDYRHGRPPLLGSAAHRGKHL